MLRYINKLSKIETSGTLILDMQLKTSNIVQKLNNINWITSTIQVKMI